MFASCGAPGEPVERKAPTPTAINDLAATQQGDNVTLTFTLPKDSVEGRELKQPPAIEIFRDFQSVPPARAVDAQLSPAVDPPTPVAGRVDGDFRLAGRPTKGARTWTRRASSAR